MPERRQVRREEAVEALGRFGITGAEVYLVDLVPLIEMLWADGQNQDSEVALLEDFAQQHVERINQRSGYEVLSEDHTRRFLSRFLHERPDPALLSTLRNLVAATRMQTSEPAANEAARQCLLNACLDIAAAAVTRYPFGLHERFDADEKKCFFEILDAMEPPDTRGPEGSNT